MNLKADRITGWPPIHHHAWWMGNREVSVVISRPLIRRGRRGGWISPAADRLESLILWSRHSTRTPGLLCSRHLPHISHQAQEPIPSLHNHLAVARYELSGPSRPNEESPRNPRFRGLSVNKSATTYSPTGRPRQYHPRCRA